MLAWRGFRRRETVAWLVPNSTKGLLGIHRIVRKRGLKRACCRLNAIKVQCFYGFLLTVEGEEVGDRGSEKPPDEGLCCPTLAPGKRRKDGARSFSIFGPAQ